MNNQLVEIRTDKKGKLEYKFILTQEMVKSGDCGQVIAAVKSVMQLMGYPEWMINESSYTTGFDLHGTYHNSWSYNRYASDYKIEFKETTYSAPTRRFFSANTFYTEKQLKAKMDIFYNIAKRKMEKAADKALECAIGGQVKSTMLDLIERATRDTGLQGFFTEDDMIYSNGVAKKGRKSLKKGGKYINLKRGDIRINAKTLTLHGADYDAKKICKPTSLDAQLQFSITSADGYNDEELSFRDCWNSAIVFKVPFVLNKEGQYEIDKGFYKNSLALFIRNLGSVADSDYGQTLNIKKMLNGGLSAAQIETKLNVLRDRLVAITTFKTLVEVAKGNLIALQSIDISVKPFCLSVIADFLKLGDIEQEAQIDYCLNPSAPGDWRAKWNAIAEKRNTGDTFDGLMCDDSFKDLIPYWKFISHKGCYTSVKLTAKHSLI